MPVQHRRSRRPARSCSSTAVLQSGSVCVPSMQVQRTSSATSRTRSIPTMPHSCMPRSTVQPGMQVSASSYRKLSETSLIILRTAALSSLAIRLFFSAWSHFRSFPTVWESCSQTVGTSVPNAWGECSRRLGISPFRSFSCRCQYKSLYLQDRTDKPQPPYTKNMGNSL